MEQRAAERRVSRVAVHWPDRRSGFDRRHPSSRRGRMIAAYGRRPAAIALVLGLVVFLNAADLWLTVRALERGAVEVNPVMRVLLDTRPAIAVLFKVGIGLAVAAALWQLRRYRRVLEASLVLLGGFAVLTAYHLIGAAALSG